METRIPKFSRPRNYEEAISITKEQLLGQQGNVHKTYQAYAPPRFLSSLEQVFECNRGDPVRPGSSMSVKPFLGDLSFLWTCREWERGVCTASWVESTLSTQQSKGIRMGSCVTPSMKVSASLSSWYTRIVESRSIGVISSNHQLEDMSPSNYIARCISVDQIYDTQIKFKIRGFIYLLKYYWLL